MNVPTIKLMFVPSQPKLPPNQLLRNLGLDTFPKNVSKIFDLLHHIGLYEVSRIKNPSQDSLETMTKKALHESTSSHPEMQITHEKRSLPLSIRRIPQKQTHECLSISYLLLGLLALNICTLFFLADTSSTTDQTTDTEEEITSSSSSSSSSSLTSSASTGSVKRKVPKYNSKAINVSKLGFQSNSISLVCSQNSIKSTVSSHFSTALIGPELKSVFLIYFTLPLSSSVHIGNISNVSVLISPYSLVTQLSDSVPPSLSLCTYLHAYLYLSLTLPPSLHLALVHFG